MTTTTTSPEATAPHGAGRRDHADQPAHSRAWLELVSAVDYLTRTKRRGLTVYDALEEALRWWIEAQRGEPATHDTTTSRPWTDPAPLRTTLEELVATLDPPGIPGATLPPDAIHTAITTWNTIMSTRHNDGAAWVGMCRYLGSAGASVRHKPTTIEERDGSGRPGPKAAGRGTDTPPPGQRS